PLHEWVVAQLPGRLRLAALATTALILLIVLLPFTWLGWNAFLEGRGVFVYLNDQQNRQDLIHKAETLIEKLPFSDQFLGPPAEKAAGQPQPVAPKSDAPRVATGVDQPPLEPDAEPPAIEPGSPVNLTAIFRSAAGWFGGLLLNTAQGLARMLLGLVIMVLAVYYFLADGPAMIRTVMLLSPLESEYERELLDKFSNVSRAVVVAVLASAVVQGLLAGLGFYLALDAGAPIFLLTMATMLLAVVPFVGAAGVWIPTCLWIFFYQGQRIVDGHAATGEPVKALILALYCAGVVSTIDNVIKPLILHGQSNLHPLLALMSVLGGVTALGPVGILVGPMLVAFIHALLVMVNKELRLLSGEVIDPAYHLPASPGTAGVVEAEAGREQPAGVLEQLRAAIQVPGSAKGAARGPLARVRESAKRRRRRK
ncbi:MAG: AI-2E family transporter, partial [Pirellulales bacterium]|nr:AI-2E family transporter [Pirellulales bacterium]